MRILAPPNGYLYPLKGWVELLKVSCLRPEHAWGAWRERQRVRLGRCYITRGLHTPAHTHTHTHKVLTHVDLATLCTFLQVAIPD